MASDSKKYYDKNPKSKAKKKKYDTKYNKKTMKDRTSRNKARRIMKSKGVNVKGKDVDHKNGNPKDNRKSNLRVISKSKNRGKK